MKVSPKKILLFDDHAIVIEGLKVKLEPLSNITITSATTRVSSLREDLEKFSPDIAIMDIINDEVDGVGFFEEIRNSYPDLKIIAYSSLKSPIVVRHLKEIGINGFARKNGNPNEILDAVEAVLTGENFYSPDFDLVSLTEGEGIPSLTGTEKHVLSELYNGLTSKEIAAKQNRSFNTVNNHRKSIIKKFKCRNTSEMLSKAVALGML